jgi:hypothetical protein
VGGGVGGLNSDDGTDILLFWLYYDPSTLPTFPILSLSSLSVASDILPLWDASEAVRPEEISKCGL